MTTYAVRAEGIGKAFKRTVALDGVDLAVPAGTIHGLLGRNGAGKTTLLRILTALIPPDRGEAEVAGFDVHTDAARVRARIGVAGQSATVDELLTGRQNLAIVGELFHLSKKVAAARAAELLEQFGMTYAADRLAKGYSGGMRRRLDLAASMVAGPAVLFLDEPTTGLDPVSRRGVWEAIEDLVEESGTTVVLTTQYLEEANELADRVTVIDGGRVVASGSPSDLRRDAGSARVRIVLRDPVRTRADVCALVGGVPDGPDRVLVLAPEGLASLATVVGRLAPLENEVEDVGLVTPSLDEVFAAITTEPAVLEAHR
jgi:ABC-2 type transport system ATP-binding protein